MSFHTRTHTHTLLCPCLHTHTCTLSTEIAESALYGTMHEEGERQPLLNNEGPVFNFSGPTLAAPQFPRINRSAEFVIGEREDISRRQRRSVT